MVVSDQLFAAAFIDGSESSIYSNTRILGVRLRKFCLWHRLLLKTIDSPFITGQPIFLGDLARAVGVCRLGFDDSRITKPRLGPFLLKGRAFLKGMRSVTKPGEKPPLVKLLSVEVERFIEYTKDYTQEPEYSIIPPETNGVPQRSRPQRTPPPAEAAQVAELITWGRWTEKQIWEMPLGRLHWYRSLAMMMSGADIDYIDDAEREFMASLPPEFRRN
jgi:hypothetical protein